MGGRQGEGADVGLRLLSRPYMSRKERLARGLEITKRLFEQVDINDW